MHNLCRIGNKWQLRICKTYLGTFSDAHEAQAARDKHRALLGLKPVLNDGPEPAAALDPKHKYIRRVCQGYQVKTKNGYHGTFDSVEKALQRLRELKEGRMEGERGPGW